MSDPADDPHPLTFTPADLLRLRRSLSAHCRTCAVLRDVGLEALAEARPDQRLAEMMFRCHKCGQLGTPLLTWRDEGNGWRSFDYGKVAAGEAVKT